MASKGMAFKAAALVGLGLLAAPMAAKADYLAYADAAGSQATNFYGYNLGMDFSPNQNITVTGLGLFSQSGTFGATDYATIFNATTGAVIAQMTFSAAATGTAFAGTADYVQALATPVTLLAGVDYDVAAFYTGAVDGYINGNGTNSDPTTNPMGSVEEQSGLVTYYGLSYYGNAGDTQNILPENGDGGPANRFGAATFTFAAASAVPEPSSIMLMLAGLVGFSAYRFGGRKASKFS